MLLPPYIHLPNVLHTKTTQKTKHLSRVHLFLWTREQGWWSGVEKACLSGAQAAPKACHGPCRDVGALSLTQPGCSISCDAPIEALGGCSGGRCLGAQPMPVVMVWFMGISLLEKGFLLKDTHTAHIQTRLLQKCCFCGQGCHAHLACFHLLWLLG